MVSKMGRVKEDIVMVVIIDKLEVFSAVGCLIEFRGRGDTENDSCFVIEGLYIAKVYRFSSFNFADLPVLTSVDSFCKCPAVATRPDNSFTDSA